MATIYRVDFAERRRGEKSKLSRRPDSQGLILSPAVIELESLRIDRMIARYQELGTVGQLFLNGEGPSLDLEIGDQGQQISPGIALAFLQRPRAARS